MVKHIVFFKFKATEDKAERMSAIKRELEKLPAVISELKEIKVGININPAEEWDLSLEALVNDMESLASYANHPAHQRIGKEMIVPIKEGRAWVDYAC